MTFAHTSSMRAEIISVGTELLLGQIVDTNAALLGSVLPEWGIWCTHRQTLGDNRERLADAIRLALSRSEIVFLIGGLGPTQDDLTRFALADALEDDLVEDDVEVEKLREVFAVRKLRWTESQLRQALRPEGSRFIDNPVGSASGILAQTPHHLVACLPGPPHEFREMLFGPVKEVLSSAFPSQEVLVSRVLRVAGVGEATVEERLTDLMNGENPTVAPYAGLGEVKLRLSARANSQEGAKALLDPLEQTIRERLHTHVFGVDETTLESAVIHHLVATGATLAVCESCTGGMLGGRITKVPGSSGVFMGGLLTYSNGSKVSLAEVPEATLAEFGAVSSETACAMALGAQRRLGATYGLSITGIAGPGGGTPEKPVGLVYIGLATPHGVEAREYRFRLRREQVREASVQCALTLLWLELQK